MSNELVRAAQKTLVNTDDATLTKETGKALAKVSVGAGGLYLLAGALPFITFPMLLIIAFLGGMFLLLKD
jgi:hypothetical protein